MIPLTSKLTKLITEHSPIYQAIVRENLTPKQFELVKAEELRRFQETKAEYKARIDDPNSSPSTKKYSQEALNLLNSRKEPPVMPAGGIIYFLNLPTPTYHPCAIFSNLINTGKCPLCQSILKIDSDKKPTKSIFDNPNTTSILCPIHGLLATQLQEFKIPGVLNIFSVNEDLLTFFKPKSKILITKASTVEPKSNTALYIGIGIVVFLLIARRK